MIRVVAIALLLATSACGGFDTGLNPGPDVSKQQGPLTTPPAAVVRGIPDAGAGQARPPSTYTPSRIGAGATSLRCVPRATGLGSDCRPL
ncbi:MAG: hypothetical protein ACRYF2_07890 [Janthinobacterium lividum]